MFKKNSIDKNSGANSNADVRPNASIGDEFVNASAATPVTRMQVVGMASQGVALSLIQKIGGIALSLILVRILSKEDFGTFNIASTAVLFMMTVSVQSFAEHSFFVGRDSSPRYDRHLGFALVLHGAIFVLVLAFAAAAMISSSYTQVAPLLLFGAVAPLLNAPRIIYTVSLSRDLNWKRIRLLGISSFAFAACGTITLAVLGFGGLALMCQIVLAPIPFVADMVLNRRELFAVSFDFKGYRESFNFGSFRSGGAAMLQGQKMAESLIVGGTVGLEVLGVFGRAFALAQLTTGWLSQQLASITYPILAKFEPNTSGYRRASGVLFRFCVWTAAPPAVAVAVADKAAITVIYGERWLDLVPYLQPIILAVLSLTIIAGANVVALGALGARFVFLVQLAILLQGLIGLALALPISLTVYAWFVAASLFAISTIVVAILVHVRALALKDVVRTTAPAMLLVALAMIAVASPVWRFVETLPHFLALLLVSAASATTMLLLIRLLDAFGLAEALRFMPAPFQRGATRVLGLVGLSSHANRGSTS
ncbi:oligosaccharide flippase family protein [Thalassovita mediterranea]|nr:oligosaccharide flippase family protein [Thalassovita mediterranea]